MKLKHFFFIIGILLTADTFSKFFAENFKESQYLIIPNLLSFQYAQNTGIAFSIPLTGIFLKIITVILIFGIFWYYKSEERPKKNRVLDIGYAFIFAGALGNAWERIFRGYVTDFISVEHFSIFNLADSYITLGAIILLYHYLKHKN